MLWGQAVLGRELCKKGTSVKWGKEKFWWFPLWFQVMWKITHIWQPNSTETEYDAVATLPIFFCKGLGVPTIYSFNKHGLCPSREQVWDQGRETPLGNMLVPPEPLCLLCISLVLPWPLLPSRVPSSSLSSTGRHWRTQAQLPSRPLTRPVVPLAWNPQFWEKKKNRS